MISTSDIRAYICGDPIVDWLALYGRENGYEPDNECEGYLPQCDFLQFIRRKGRQFENAIVELLHEKLEVVRISGPELPILDPAAPKETIACMKRGVECIWQGVFVDEELGVIGVPDLLVRADRLNRIVPGTNGGEGDHYVAVDIKFTTIDLAASGEIGNHSSQEFYKAQLALYTWMLAKIQGFDTKRGYLLGRGWKNSKERGSSALEKLGVVTFPQPQWKAPDRDWTQEALDAVQWLKDVRDQGAGWQAVPIPSRQELRPDMSNQNDAPWRKAKQEIAKAQEDLTFLWNVGGTKRDAAARMGVTKFSDPRCCGQMCGLKDDQARILDAILDVNFRPGPVVRPAQITAGRDVWGECGGVEFFVDFETVSDLDDDMSRLPEKGGYPGIFMIGCGHEEDGAWRFECFIADPFDEEGERTVIDQWLWHMDAVKERLAPDCERPVIYHWSNAEVSVADTAYNSAFRRLNEERVQGLNWFDLWKNVFRAQPVVVKGAWGFGLKAIAKNLRLHGLVETVWADGPTDGLGAMAGAWWCYEEAKAQGIPVMDLCLPDRDRRLMQEIRDYNEVDCKVMWETLAWLRTNCGHPGTARVRAEVEARAP